MERRLAAILAADMVGYSRLMGDDEAGTLARLEGLKAEILDPLIAQHRGRVVKLMGDGFLVEFASVVDALACALAWQDAVEVRAMQVSEDRAIRFRIGVNIGDIMVKGDDVYGDGVNVAARLEGMAEPGSVLVSRTVFDHAKGKVDATFEDLGEQELKNIAEPVRVFRVSMASKATGAPTVAKTAPKSRRLPVIAGILVLLAVATSATLWQRPWEPREEPASIERMAFPLPDKPSIAVLPFTNLSADPNQEYFVDGMTEDLITDLAKIESLFVIARNTVFTYKGKSVVVPDVARELGVKYVLEGSVRRVGDVVRINAQLIDGVSGAHIWAERYDGTLADIFALQDEVTREIVAQLQITLTPDEQSHQNRKDTDNPEAYDAYLRGWQLYRRYTPEDFFEAIPHLERAVELDPDFGRAWATLASIYWTAYRNGISWALIVKPSNLGARMSWIGARDYAVKYLAKAKRNPTPLAHQVDSLIWSEYRQFDEALAEAEQAVALDPNDPEGHLAMAWALIFAGRSEAAISFAENAIRLDPHFPANYRFALGTAQLMLERFTAAEATLKSAFELNPEEMEIQAPLAVAYAQLNKNEKAKDALRKYTDFWIFFDRSSGIETHMTFWPFKREADIRLFGGGLVKAGLCCDEQLETYIGKLRQGGTLE